MKKVIMMTMLAFALLMVGGCGVITGNPYESTMQSLDAKGGMIDQNDAYIRADNKLTQEQKERRLTENAALRLTIQRSTNSVK